MSVPSVDSESSQSSSGYEDGLGRRVLAFDRETGDMLERLVLRPELSVFEAALRERLTIVSGLEDERFTRPRDVERGPDDRLTVVSESIAGRRLSDLLDAAAEHGIIAGLDAGLGVLLELLPALARLHDAGLAHGALAPGRIMVTSAGQLVLLDSIYAEALERLKLSRQRLWSEFRLAFASSAGGARFDKAADLGHAAMVGAALSVGRPLRDDDYPDGIPVLREEIVEIASIRGSKTFADAVDAFFGATLPLGGRRAKGGDSADEAASDLRKLVRKELGISTCRTALLEFFQQVEAADAERLTAEASQQSLRRAETERLTAQQASDAVRLEAERDEAERLERDRADAERREQEHARERAEADRREQEEALEQERAVQARAEAERADQARLEAERLEEERAEQARVEAERTARAEAERLEVERVERERAEQARLEAERLEQARAEVARLEAERLERERLETERLERERAEKARREKERLEKERLEKERAAKERAEKERAEKERVEKERAEKARLEVERQEKERLEKERAAKERAEKERLEKERAEKARLEAERLEKERIEKERAEKARLEKERLEKERAERARLEAERLEKERAEKARLEAERQEKERLERERAEKARLEKERVEKERAEKARLEAERLERERVERERRERVAKERAEKARLELERAEKARLHAERLEKERVEAERRERELLEAARTERDRAEKARLEAERLEAERAEHARLEAEREEQEEIRERAERARVEAERVEAERRELEREREQTRAREQALEREREQERQRLEAEAQRREPAAPAAAAASSWLIPPDRAAKFEPILPAQPPAAATPPTTPAAPAARAYPIYVPPSEPASWTPDPHASAAPILELEPVAGSSNAGFFSGGASHGSGGGTIRLKDEPIGFSPSTWARADSRHEPDSMSAEGAYEPFATNTAARPIPWKLIAAGVVLIGATVAIMRGYTPASAPLLQTVRNAAPAAAPAPAPPPASGTEGRLAITTQPVGARVTLDGKAVGQTPLTLDTVSPGRHVITVTAPSGAAAKRTIRIEAGKTATIDLPLFSGFAAISAPFVIDVSEGGKSLGTSTDQILLTPGRHDLRLSNKELGYVATETVEIQPGEVTRVSVDPRGRANINAAPWAEVWIDGEKAGETPLANVAIRLGVREIVFKNPQFGERKVTTTITANAPATISVDFNK
jgi:hypothetical protein